MNSSDRSIGSVHRSQDLNCQLGHTESQVNLKLELNDTTVFISVPSGLTTPKYELIVPLIQQAVSALLSAQVSVLSNLHGGSIQ
jgi:hypothetical protein